MNPLPNRNQSGFLLITVAIVLGILGAIALALSGATSLDNALVMMHRDRATLDYVVESALEHATWQLAQNDTCTAYSSLASTPFGSDNYGASFAPTFGSPVSITVTGSLVDGTTRGMSKDNVRAYQESTTVNLQPGAAGEDTYIRDGANDSNNFGAATILKINNSSAEEASLLKFDLSGIPANAVLNSAMLEMWLEGGIDLTDGVIDVHRITQTWVEGDKDGQAPPAGAGATYMSYNGQTNWASPGGDYVMPPIDSVTIPALVSGWYQWNLTTAALDWIAGAAPNDGVLLRASGGNVQKIWFTSGDGIEAQRPKLDVVYRCECGQACTALGVSGTLLLVVGDASNLENKDESRKSLFMSWGYAVTVIDDSANQSMFDTEAAVNDVIYVSGTIVDAILSDKLSNSPTPMVNESVFMVAEFGFSDTDGSSEISSEFTVTNSLHYITEPFDGNAVTVFTSNLAMASPGGTLAPDIQNVGEVTAGVPTLAALAAGAEKWDGTLTSARQVYLPFQNSEISQLTVDGQTLMRRAIEWAGGTGCGRYASLAMIVTDEGSPTADESARVALLTSWCYAVTLQTASEPEAVYDQVALGFDIVYVPSTVSYSDVLSKLKFQPTGVVNEVSGLSAYLGFTSGTSGYSATTTAIVDDTHFITLSFDPGSLPITLSIQPLHRLVNSMGPGLHVLSTRPASSDPMLMTLEAGDELLWGGVAPDRRVMLPWGGAAFDVDMLTVDGQTLLRKALEWGADAMGGGGGQCDNTFRDEFNAISYGNNDGTLVWTTDWLEINESDGPTNGDERIDNNGGGYHLVVKDNDGGGEGVQREADLSAGISATLRFDYRRISFDKNSDFVTLDISNDGGSNWVEIDRFSGPGNDSTYFPVSHDVSAYIAADTRIRFLTSPNLGGGDKLYIDNVQIDLSGCSGN